MAFIRAQRTRGEILADDPLSANFVWWMGITWGDVQRLMHQIESATKEQDMQTYLAENPAVLIQHLGGGHGRYVIPQKQLGAEYVTDFVIGHKHSGGFEWQAVELENPKARMFTKAGNPTKELTHAIRQIQDWRAWLQRNQNYAARPATESGLGLTDIVSNVPGLILIGRRSASDLSTQDRRRQMVNDLNIQIHSYDFLIDNCDRVPEAW